MDYHRLAFNRACPGPGFRRGQAGPGHPRRWGAIAAQFGSRVKFRIYGFARLTDMPFRLTVILSADKGMETTVTAEAASNEGLFLLMRRGVGELYTTLLDDLLADLWTATAPPTAHERLTLTRPVSTDPTGDRSGC